MFRSPRWFATFALGFGIAAVSVPHLIGQPEAAPPLPRELTSFSPIVKRILPAVVSIEGKAKAAKTPAKADDVDPGFGSGVLVDPSGVVLTNNHVVSDADSVDVTLTDGRKFASRDIRRDPKSDLAIIKLTATLPLPFLEFADSTAVEVGDRVLAAGSPFGLMGSVTHGIISGKSRNNLRLNPYEDWLQTDAAVNPGSSGGPLVTLDGKLIGITAAIKTRSGGFSGVGLAVASNLCKTVSTQLLKDGVVHRGYLGAHVRELDEAVATKLGVKMEAGVIITKVEENTPAGKSGLAVSDVITSIAGQPIKIPRDVQRIVSNLPLGKPAEFGIVRDGKALAAQVTIEEQPADFGIGGAAANPGKIQPFQNLGIALTDLTPDLAGRLGFAKDTKGAAVVAVTRGGVAEQAGLRAGHVVVQVDKTPITTAAGFEQAVSRADQTKGALIHVQRPSGEIEFAVLKVN
ncbi:MAG TPA: trypsin-like peptidase domain-containing protein [Urbifossiella sp.]